MLEPVDDLVHELARIGLERRDLLRGELRIHEPAILGVFRGVDLQRDERSLLADVDGHQSDEKISGWRSANFTSSYRLMM